MKLLFVLPAYEPAWAFGGIVRCMSDLCRGLAARGHRVVVYTINADGTGHSLPYVPADPVDQGGVQVYYFRSMFRRGSVFHSRELVAFLERTVETYDLVYCSATWQWLGVRTARVCQKHGVLLVIGPHGSFDDLRMRHHGMRKQLFWKTFLRQEVESAAAIHFVSDYEKKQSTKWVGCRPSFVVPNAVDLKQFRPIGPARATFRGRYGLNADRSLAITVARPDPIKRINLLIEALSQESRVDLVIVGPMDGPVASSWHSLARQLGVAERVRWLGLLAGDDLVEAYSAADVFVLPSLDENFGLVVVEALACETPVIVTPEVGVWGEICDVDVGQAVTGASDALAQVLGDVVENRMIWRQRGRRGPSVIQRFAVARIAERMEICFREIINGK
jgi:glycosyltransferase involved in cell wall biosynthesis